MKILNLKLNTYRNYNKESVSFADGLNVIIGGNAQGKTNMLESIYYLSISKSLRTNNDGELINFKTGGDYSNIYADILKHGGKRSLEIVIPKRGKKTIKINGTPVLKVGELLGELSAVYFSPDEMRLVKDGPENRRRFLDVAISSGNKYYFYSLLKYQKILAQRNKLLKETDNLDKIKDSLEIFTIQLINEAAKIILERQKFISEVKPYLSNISNELTGEKEEVLVEYEGVSCETLDKIKAELTKQFKKNMEKDFKLQCTSFGPHRDDLKITLNGIDLRAYGSQGQKRTATLALKLSELEIGKARHGEYPILLLDDVLSELELDRQKQLLKICEKTQVILTCTEFNFTNVKANFIKIKEGKVI